ncbi:MAG: tRNA glutamyl-Q(34) synthetase GluQRS [Oxalobacter sp.]|nr:tRNA glutamyl-Q(34) synthetase GluQRS [Oxalobacter sp.]
MTDHPCKQGERPESRPVYRGRFAPSPTGDLHFGSMVAAVGSYLDAKANNGEWIVRIEDVDITRCTPESAVSILGTLEKFGFEWDGPIVYQSGRTELYQDYFDRLKGKGMVYGCSCSRKALAANPKGIDGAPLYLGRCRNGIASGGSVRSWRLRVPDAEVGFVDRIQGFQSQQLLRDVGDFVIRRADGLFAYQFAVVVDDIEQGITDVIRGADLLDSTPRQIWLYQCLDQPPPSYAHLPLAVNASHEKLSKQTKAAPVAGLDPVPLLKTVLSFLGIQLTAEDCSLEEFWKLAISNWDIEKVYKKHDIESLI